MRPSFLVFYRKESLPRQNRGAHVSEHVPDTVSPLRRRRLEIRIGKVDCVVYTESDHLFAFE